MIGALVVLTVLLLVTYAAGYVRGTGAQRRSEARALRGDLRELDRRRRANERRRARLLSDESESLL